MKRNTIAIPLALLALALSGCAPEGAAPSSSLVDGSGSLATSLASSGAGGSQSTSSSAEGPDVSSSSSQGGDLPLTGVDLDKAMEELKKPHRIQLDATGESRFTMEMAPGVSTEILYRMGMEIDGEYGIGAYRGSFTSQTATKAIIEGEEVEVPNGSMSNFIGSTVFEDEAGLAYIEDYELTGEIKKDRIGFNFDSTYASPLSLLTSRDFVKEGDAYYLDHEAASLVLSVFMNQPIGPNGSSSSFQGDQGRAEAHFESDRLTALSFTMDVDLGGMMGAPNMDPLQLDFDVTVDSYEDIAIPHLNPRNGPLNADQERLMTAFETLDEPYEMELRSRSASSTPETVNGRYYQGETIAYMEPTDNTSYGSHYLVAPKSDDPDGKYYLWDQRDGVFEETYHEFPDRMAAMSSYLRVYAGLFDYVDGIYSFECPDRSTRTSVAAVWEAIMPTLIDYLPGFSIHYWPNVMEITLDGEGKLESIKIDSSVGNSYTATFHPFTGFPIDIDDAPFDGDPVLVSALEAIESLRGMKKYTFSGAFTEYAGSDVPAITVYQGEKSFLYLAGDLEYGYSDLVWFVEREGSESLVGHRYEDFHWEWAMTDYVPYEGFLPAALTEYDYDSVSYSFDFEDPDAWLIYIPEEASYFFPDQIIRTNMGIDTSDVAYSSDEVRVEVGAGLITSIVYYVNGEEYARVDIEAIDALPFGLDESTPLSQEGELEESTLIKEAISGIFSPFTADYVYLDVDGTEHTGTLHFAGYSVYAEPEEAGLSDCWIVPAEATDGETGESIPVDAAVMVDEDHQPDFAGAAIIDYQNPSNMIFDESIFENTYFYLPSPLLFYVDGGAFPLYPWYAVALAHGREDLSILATCQIDLDPLSHEVEAVYYFDPDGNAVLQISGIRPYEGLPGDVESTIQAL